MLAVPITEGQEQTSITAAGLSSSGVDIGVSGGIQREILLIQLHSDI